MSSQPADTEAKQTESALAQVTQEDTSKLVGRSIKGKFLSQEQPEGRGARVRRSIGRPEIPQFDPFLMLDEFNVVPPGGFPDHPHRGMSTCTYILPGSEGTILHEDFTGHAGEIGAGDVQWMNAGRGIVHAEMPGNGKPARGLQLWINLSKKDKMSEPSYQELPASKIPKVEKDGVHAAVIAGRALGTEANIYTLTPIHYIHFTLQPGAVLRHPIPSTWNVLIYTLDGTGYIGPNAEECNEEDLVKPHHSVTLNQWAGSKTESADGVVVKASDKGFSFILVAGEPLNEPVAWHGPFVMNTRQEIMQTIMDFQYGLNGFEKAPSWVSKIRNRWQ